MPYLGAIVYLSTFVRYSDFVTFSHIPQALHFHSNASFCAVLDILYKPGPPFRVLYPYKGVLT